MSWHKLRYQLSRLYVYIYSSSTKIFFVISLLLLKSSKKTKRTSLITQMVGQSTTNKVWSSCRNFLGLASPRIHSPTKTYNQTCTIMSNTVQGIQVLVTRNSCF
jgi:hypothetical protein